MFGNEQKVVLAMKDAWNPRYFRPFTAIYSFTHSPLSASRPFTHSPLSASRPFTHSLLYGLGDYDYNDTLSYLGIHPKGDKNLHLFGWLDL